MSAQTGLPTGGVEIVDPPWDAWEPSEVTERLAGVPARWCVAAGWAVDLFLGEQTREHEDLEIAVPAADFQLISKVFAGYEFDVVGAGRRWPRESPAFDLLHQTWLREPATGVYRLDVFRDEHEADTWICRRDRSIRRPYAEIIHHTAEGIPFLAPDVVLLFKAKHVRPKDQVDFEHVLPRLSGEQRSWLRSSLDRVHPGHMWEECL
jgi:hypothetical protein